MKAKKCFMIGVLISLAGVVSIFLILWGAVNLFLNSSPGRRLLASKVAAAVGAPLEFDRATVMPWGVVRMTGVKMDVPEGGESSSPFFESRELEIRAAPASLLGRRVEVSRVILVEPVISLVRDEAGGFLLPSVFRDRPPEVVIDAGPVGAKIDEVGHVTAPLAERKEAAPAERSKSDEPQGAETEVMVGAEAAKSAGEELESVDESQGDRSTSELVEVPQGAAHVGQASSGGARVGDGGSNEAPAPEVEANTVVDKPPAEVAMPSENEERPERRPMVVRYGTRYFHFGDMVIKKGRFRILSDEGSPVLDVQDVELALSMHGSPPEGGDFKASSAVIFGEIEVENLRSPVVTDGVTLGLPAFECDFRGGTIKGRVEANALARGLPFLVGLEFEDIPMQVASDLFGGRISFSGGDVEGQVQLLGLLRIPTTYRGKGQVRVEGAMLERNQLLGRTAPAAGVNALQGFEFEEVSMRFAVLQEQVLVEELKVVSPDLSASARGYIGLRGDLNMAARLYVSERVFHGAKALEDRFPEPAGFGFRAFEGSSRFYRDYLIQGSILEPTIDFLVNGPRMKVEEMRDVMLKLSNPGVGGANR